VSILGESAITRTRYGVNTRDDDGRTVVGAASTLACTGAVQPVNGKDLQTLPEGERQQRGVKIYTETEFLCGDDQAGTRSDRVTVPSGHMLQGVYEVRSVTPWPAVLPHYEVVAVRVALAEGTP
jgi:hypothetical protein